MAKRSSGRTKQNMKETDDSNAVVSGDAKTKVKAKPIFVFVKQGRTDHQAEIVDPEVLRKIEELGPGGWRLTDIPDNEYIVIKWNSTGRCQSVPSTDVVLQDETDYGRPGVGGSDLYVRNTRHSRYTTTASTKNRHDIRGGGGGGGTNSASTSTDDDDENERKRKQTAVNTDNDNENDRKQKALGSGDGGGTNTASASTRSRRGGDGGTNAASASTRTSHGAGGGGSGGGTNRRGGNGTNTRSTSTRSCRGTPGGGFAGGGGINLSSTSTQSGTNARKEEGDDDDDDDGKETAVDTEEKEEDGNDDEGKQKGLSIVDEEQEDGDRDDEDEKDRKRKKIEEEEAWGDNTEEKEGDGDDDDDGKVRKRKHKADDTEGEEGEEGEEEGDDDDDDDNDDNDDDDDDKKERKRNQRAADTEEVGDDDDDDDDNKEPNQQAVDAKEEELHQSLFEDDNDTVDDENDDGGGNDTGKKKNKTEWQFVKPSKLNVSVVFGESQKEQWKQGKREIERARAMLEDKCDSTAPTLQDILKLMYGKGSDVYRVFKQKLKWNHQTFCSFLATMSLQAALKLSTADLYTKSSNRINKEGLMNEQIYRQAWRDIGNANPSPQEEGPNNTRSGRVYFWKELQTAMNTTYRTLFVFDEYHQPGDKDQFVVDDFKVYFNTRIDEQHGLKMSQHVRKNRRGPVLHQMVRSASGLGVAVYAEMKSDTSFSSTIQMIKGALLPMQGGNLGNITDLPNTLFHTDRGYKNTDTVLLQSGADINGTDAKTLNSPFVMTEKKKNDDDPRYEVNEMGGKTSFIMKGTIPNVDKPVFCHAYRNGYGGVVIGKTSLYPSYKWEFVLNNPKDINWYQHNATISRKYWDDPDHDKFVDMRIANIKRCFPSIGKALSMEFIELINDTKAVPLTTAQRTAEWFILRGFSFTSRSCYAVVKLLLKATKNDISNMIIASRNHEDNNTTNTIIDDVLEALNVFRCYLGIAVIDYEDSGSSSRYDDGNGSNNNNTSGIFFSSSLSVDEYVECMQSIKTNDDDGINPQLFTPALEAALMIGLDKKYGLNKNKKSAAKQLLGWLECPWQMRQVYFNTQIIKSNYNSMSDEYKDTEKTKPNINECRTKLKHYYEANSIAVAIQLPQQQTRSYDDFSLSEKCTKALLDSTYMPKLTGRGKEWAKKGDERELTILLRFKKEILDKDISAGDFYDNNVIFYEFCNTPLVGIRSGYQDINDTDDSDDSDDDDNNNNIANMHTFMWKASADFLARASIDGKIAHVGIEVKCRVTLRTKHQQMELVALGKLRKHERYRGVGNRSGMKYFILHWKSKLLRKFLHEEKEMCQILHCATIYRCKYWMLLIGDSNGNVICGILVDFTDLNDGTLLLFTAWVRMIDSVCAPSMQPFVTQNWSVLDRIAKSVKINKTTTLDLHTVRQWYWIYNYCCTQYHFPFPPCKRLLPIIFVDWNAYKGASDTKSKYVSYIDMLPATKSGNGIMTCLLLLDFSTSPHRCHHIATAKRDLTFYPSMYHFRHAANERSSLRNTLFLSVEEFLILGRIVVSTTNIPSSSKSSIPASMLASTPILLQNASTLATTTHTSTISSNINLSITGGTPKRDVFARYNELKLRQEQRPLSNNDREALVRQQKCMGPVVFIDNEETKLLRQQQQSGSENKDDYFGGNKICAFCKRQHANWYCFGCHHWFHHGKQSPILKTRLQLDTSGLNKKVVTCISCYNYMHPMIFGKSDFFDSAEFDNDKIQEIKNQANTKNTKKKITKRTSTTLSTITETEIETETSISAAETRVQQFNNTAAGRGRTDGRGMSTRSNHGGRFIGNSKRKRR